MTDSKYITLTRPDDGKVYVRRDNIEYLLQRGPGFNTEVRLGSGNLFVKESAEDILRDID